jgi:TfoX/Sxy family transcriptional regulator of competence genes
MAYDEKLAQRMSAIFAEETIVEEKKMFGGLCYMVNGHMCCGIVKDELMLRVGRDHYEKLLAKPHAHEMDFTGRSLKGMLYVGAEGIKTKTQLGVWMRQALAFVRSLPPK